MSKRIKERDKVTLGKIVEMADDVSTKQRSKGVKSCSPSRNARGPTLFGTKSKRDILQMGEAKATRELFQPSTRPSSSCRRACTATAFAS